MGLSLSDEVKWSWVRRVIVIWKIAVRQKRQLSLKVIKMNIPFVHEKNPLPGKRRDIK